MFRKIKWWLREIWRGPEFPKVRFGAADFEETDRQARRLLDTSNPPRGGSGVPRWPDPPHMIRVEGNLSNAPTAEQLRSLSQRINYDMEITGNAFVEVTRPPSNIPTINSVLVVAGFSLKEIMDIPPGVYSQLDVLLATQEKRQLSGQEVVSAIMPLKDRGWTPRRAVQLTDALGLNPIKNRSKDEFPGRRIAIE